MSIDDLIQLMRTCNLAKVRAELESLQRKAQSMSEAEDVLNYLIKFYKAASRRK